MRVSLIISFVISLDICAAKFFNILSVDGGGIRGLIPAQCIDKMEVYAYEYAKKKGYTVPQYEGREGRLAMKDLFEMTAGTSTGSIVAAALSYPKTDGDGKKTDVPLYWAKEIMDIYSEKGELIFKLKSISNVAAGFWLIFFLLTFSCIGYAIGLYRYANPKIQDAIDDFKEDLQNQKDSLRNKICERKQYVSRTKSSNAFQESFKKTLLENDNMKLLLAEKARKNLANKLKNIMINKQDDNNP